MVASEEGRTLTYRSWHHELELLLIEQGIHGTRQKAITKYFKDTDEDEVVGYLELLLKEEKAQKFKYNREYWWRATVNILNDVYRKT